MPRGVRRRPEGLFTYIWLLRPIFSSSSGMCEEACVHPSPKPSRFFLIIRHVLDLCVTVLPDFLHHHQIFLCIGLVTVNLPVHWALGCVHRSQAPGAWIPFPWIHWSQGPGPLDPLGLVQWSFAPGPFLVWPFSLQADTHTVSAPYMHKGQ